MKIIQKPSPNFSTSKYSVIGCQIHKTLGLMPSTLEWMRNPRSNSSAHYLITKKGEIIQMVQLKDRPWSSGRITTSKLSERAKQIMIKDSWWGYVKPGHYLVQVEYECLLYETYTEEQYKASTWLFNQFPFEVGEENFLTHKDTAIDKPDLEKERKEILGRLHKPDECDSKRLVLDNWSQLGIEVESGKIIIFKKI